MKSGKRFLITCLILLLFCSSCAYNQNWTKNNYSQEQFNNDSIECHKKANSMTSGEWVWIIPPIGAINENDKHIYYNRCLQGRGYTLLNESKPTPPPAKVVLETEPAPSPPPKPAPSAPAPPSPPKVIDKMTLHVLFHSGKSILTEADVKELQKAVAFVKKYPGANIRLDGYTDSSGTDAYNISLSERRAVAVKDYLIKEAGVSSPKIRVVGHGKADPVADNKTAEGRAKNRRVEISILSD